jgi:hypothetical protein
MEKISKESKMTIGDQLKIADIRNLMLVGYAKVYLLEKGKRSQPDAIETLKDTFAQMEEILKQFIGIKNGKVC